MSQKQFDENYLNEYVYITRAFNSKARIEVSYVMNVKQVYTNDKVYENNGRVAITRGPFVYCAEGVDHDGAIRNIHVKEDGHVKVEDYNAGLLEGIVPITVEAYRNKEQSTLYSYKKSEKENATLHMIPYYEWANRGLTQMRVWFPEEK